MKVNEIVRKQSFVVRYFEQEITINNNKTHGFFTSVSGLILTYDQFQVRKNITIVLAFKFK